MSEKVFENWSSILGTSSSDEATAVITGSDGSIYIAGVTEGDLDGQTNNNDDVFLLLVMPLLVNSI